VITLYINYDGGDYTVDFDAGDTIMTSGGEGITFTETDGAMDMLKVEYYDTDTYICGVLADVQ